MADKLTNNTGFSNKGCSNGNDSSLQKYLILCGKNSHLWLRLVFKFQQQHKKAWNNWDTKWWGNKILCTEELLIWQ